MLHVKIFTHVNTNELEADVNSWLGEHPRVGLHHICQSSAVTAQLAIFVITIIYEG
jgi:hypothetical protein